MNGMESGWKGGGVEKGMEFRFVLVTSFEIDSVWGWCARIFGNADQDEHAESNYRQRFIYNTEQVETMKLSFSFFCLFWLFL